MKLLLILVLAALLTGCTASAPAETIPDQPKETAETSLPDQTTPDPISADTPYTGDIFYFTKLPAAESAAPEMADEIVVIPPQPENTYRALAAVTFDFSAYPSWNINNYSGTIISYTDEPATRHSIEYLRMNADGIVYPTDEEKFTSPMGYTADGVPFFWETRAYPHPEIEETGTEYLTYLRLNDSEMLCISFYSYSYDEDFEGTTLRPLLTSCRTWNGETPLTCRFLSYPDAAYHQTLSIDLTFPDTWQWNNSSVANDMERMYTGRYATKRMELYPYIHESQFKGYDSLTSGGIPEAVTGETDEGLPYEIYFYNSMSEGEPLKSVWYFVNIGYDGRYIQLSCLSYGDDPADYFETVILPVIESIRIAPAP